MASLRADHPIDLLLAVGDALLASPILVIVIPWQHPEAVALLTAFHDRFGDHLMLGASGIATQQDGIAAVAAHARFLMTTHDGVALHQQAKDAGILYVPSITSVTALATLQQENVAMVTMTAQRLLSIPPQLLAAAPGMLVRGEINPEQISLYAKAGAMAVDAGELLFPTVAWSMPAMIRQARQLRQLWLEANK